MPSSEMSRIDQGHYEVDALWDDALFGKEEEDKAGFLTSLIPNEVTSLLDVGCGNGHFLHFLKGTDQGSRLSRACGIDRSVSALSRVNCEKYRGEIDNLPFADNEFDLLTCNNVLEHLPIDI